MQLYKGSNSEPDCSGKLFIINAEYKLHALSACLSLQACQFTIDQNSFSKLGMQSTIQWQVTNESNFTLTYTGGDSIDDGKKGTYAR